MLTLPDNWQQLWDEEGTICEYQIEIDGEIYNSYEDIEDGTLRIVKDVFTSKKPIGNTPCFIAEFCLRNKATKPSKSAVVTISIRLVNDIYFTDFVSLGEYKIYNRSEYSDGWTMYTCRDRMQMANQKYIPTDNNWPKSMLSILQETCPLIGVTLDPRSNIQSGSDWVIPDLGSVSIRYIWSAIAAAHGGNFIITPDQALLLVVPKIQSEESSWVHCEVDDMIAAAGEGKIDKLTFKHESNELSYGTSGDNNISIENPLLIENILRYAKSNLTGTLYNPMSVKSLFCTPLAEVQDTYCVEDIPTVMSSIETVYGIVPISNACSTSLTEQSNEYGFEDTIYNNLSSKIGGARKTAKATEEGLYKLKTGLSTSMYQNPDGSYAIARSAVESAISEEVQTPDGIKLTVLADSILDLIALKNEDGSFTSLASIKATASNAYAGLGNKVTADGDKKTASSVISAAVDGAIAKIKLESFDGKTLAEIAADVISLQGRIDLSGNVSVSDGQLTVLGNLVAAKSFQVGTDSFYIAGTKYTPTQITSTSGTVIVLGTT